MATDEKRFQALGKEWVARFDFNAICEIEDRYDRPFLELVSPFLGGLDVSDKNNPAAVIQAASRIKFSDIRAILHQSLLGNHPEATAILTGEIIADVGMEKAMEVVGWAITKAMPMGDEGNAPKAKSRKS